MKAMMRKGDLIHDLILVQVEEKNNAMNPSINNHENKYIYLTTSMPDTMEIMSYSFKKTEE